MPRAFLATAASAHDGSKTSCTHDDHPAQRVHTSGRPTLQDIRPSCCTPHGLPRTAAAHMRQYPVPHPCMARTSQTRVQPQGLARHCGSRPVAEPGLPGAPGVHARSAARMHAVPAELPTAGQGRSRRLLKEGCTTLTSAWTKPAQARGVQGGALHGLGPPLRPADRAEYPAG
jgi:hypothetical protein